ncbi:MAG: rhodanese-related sulfurtransferase [Parvicellaceae bacterium]|jgi:rhodanese-related sulfurtransferase
MKLLILILLLVSTSALLAQNLDGFENMCKGYISGSIPLASPNQLSFELDRTANVVILDAREEKEYQVSHIPSAINVGFDNFNISSVKSISKDAKIYIYCSIGYRSENIGEKLKKAGYENVFNLNGGLFSWANHGFSLVDKKGNPTTKVHGFDKQWSKWLNPDKCKSVLE